MTRAEPRILKVTTLPNRLQVTIDPNEFFAAKLICDFADAWLHLSKVSEVSESTLVGYQLCIRQLGSFLCAPGDENLSLQTMTPKTISRFVDWRAHLDKKYPFPSATPQSLESKLKVLTRGFLSLKKIDNNVLDSWANSGLTRHISAQFRKPLDEFSNKERIRLVRESRDIVRASEMLLETGQKLIQVGIDPRSVSAEGKSDASWSDTANVLKAQFNSPYLSFTNRLGRNNQFVWKRLEADGVDVAFLKKHSLDRPFHPLLLPSNLYVSAVRVLLHSELDWPPDITARLKRRDVEILNDRVRVRYVKARAHQIRHIELPLSKHKNGWGAGDLFVRARRALDFAWQFGSEESSFWMCSRLIATGQRYENFPSWISPCSAVSPIRSISRKGKFKISEPQVLARLRKTQKSIRAAKFGNYFDGANNDHSIEVFRNHYAQSTTVHVLAAKTITDSQNLVFEKLFPTAIPVDSNEVISDGTNPLLVQLANEVANESANDQRMSVSSCKSPEDSPFQEGGGLCLKPFEFCLICKNAVFFKDHIPRLVAAFRLLQDKKRELHPAQFEARFSEAWGNLNSILNGFGVDPEGYSDEAFSLVVPITKVM